MRSFFLFLLVVALSSHRLYDPQEVVLTEVNDFGSNPGSLKMFIHSNFPNDTAKMPLVVVLHGCGQSAIDVMKLTGWNKLADLNHFIVLYPQQKFVNNPDLCFNWFNENDIDKNQGESESIYEMIAYAKQHYSIDTNRIFITGLSAGAAMSVVMTATHPELFKGGAIFAGGAYKIATNPMDGMKALWGNLSISKEKLVSCVKEQNPTYAGNYPPLIIYQGLKDEVVSYKSTPLLINQWTGINNTDTIPDKIEKSFQGIKDITRTEYNDSLGRTVVILYEVDHLGHAVMVKPGKKADEGGQTGLFGVNKGFHSTYQTAKDFGILLGN